MAVWYKALPLTASCLSLTDPGHVRRLPVTWSNAVAFVSYSGFHPAFTTG